MEPDLSVRHRRRGAEKAEPKPADEERAECRQQSPHETPNQITTGSSGSWVHTSTLAQQEPSEDDQE